jgi:type 1 glutamine amidotransferase
MRSLLPCLLSTIAFGQNVLHYTETSGFDHGTRDVSLTLFQTIAADHGLSITPDNDGATFSSLAALQTFDAVIFSNTSGDALLDADQRANFEAYIAGGGSVLGIHAASDTYRHSTANGNNTGVWDFYAELIGASVQQNPNHVAGTPLYDMTHIGTHASTANLPDPWNKNEEYYYWEGGYYRNDNVPVLEVEETVGPNGLVNSYDAPRPMSWYRELPEGGRVFYTALGHAGSTYTNDTLFQRHIEDALMWLLDGATSISPARQLPAAMRLWPDPASTYVVVELHQPGTFDAELLDAQGRAVLSLPVTDRQTIDLSRISDGVYTLRAPALNLASVLIVAR